MSFINSNGLDDLARRLADAVPGSIRDIGRDLEANFKAVLQAQLAKLDLVSRTEFDVQAALLARTQAALSALERASRNSRRNSVREDRSAMMAMGGDPVSVAQSRAPVGLVAPLVRVEVHLGPGLPAFLMVGLPEAVVRESRERVRSALVTAGFSFPAGRITVNLSPADLPKHGGRFDLPIAVGILAASGQLPRESLSGREFYGELALSGELRETAKLLPALVAGSRSGAELILPAANQLEAALVAGPNVKLAGHLVEVCRALRGGRPLPAARRGDGGSSATHTPRSRRGQRTVRRQAGFGNRGGRRPWVAHDRAPGSREDAAGPTLARVAAAPRRVRGAGSGEPLSRRRAAGPASRVVRRFAVPSTRHRSRR